MPINFCGEKKESNAVAELGFVVASNSLSDGSSAVLALAFVSASSAGKTLNKGLVAASDDEDDDDN